MISREINAILSPILTSMIRVSLAHPMLEAWIQVLVHRFPKLEGWIYRFALAKGLLTGRATPFYLPLWASGQIMSCWPLMNGSRLTPTARQIYEELKAAFEKQKKEV